MGVIKEIWDESGKKNSGGILFVAIKRLLFFVFFGGRSRPDAPKTFYFRFLWFMTLVSILCPPLLLVIIPLWIIRACWPKKKKKMPENKFNNVDDSDDDVYESDEE